MCIKEQTIKMSLSSFKCGRLTRAKLLVNLKKCFFLILCCILLYCCFNSFIVTEEFTNFRITSETKCTKEGCNENFTVFIYSYIEQIICISFIFKPCTAVRNNCICKQFLTCFIVLHIVINTRRTNKL